MLVAHSVLGNSQRLDGGAMFGNAPRALWSRWLAPDELGRIPLACRALLLDTGQRKILLETGIGAFFEPSLRERYGVVEQEHVLLGSLAKLGLSPSDVDVVVLSHLHFDHAGGLLAPYREGAPPELAFDRARVVVGRTAWERALRPHARDRASFIPGLCELLERSGRLTIVDEPGRATELLGEAFAFRTSDGHTPGMLHTSVRGRAAELFFCADLVPGSAWVHLPVTMGYDRFPERLIDEKTELFAELTARKAFVFFTHDPNVAAAGLTRDASGRYRPEPVFTEFTGWDLDAAPAPAA